MWLILKVRTEVCCQGILHYCQKLGGKNGKIDTQGDKEHGNDLMKRKTDEKRQWEEDTSSCRQAEDTYRRKWPKHKNKDMDRNIITQPIIKTATKSVNDEQPCVASCVLCQLPSVLCVLHLPPYPQLLSLSLFQSTSFVFSVSLLPPPPLITHDFQGEHSPVSVDTHHSKPPPKPLIPQASVVSSLSTAKVIRKETHYSDPWSIMGEISVQIAAKSHRDSD